jgi:hypothetical protein
MGKAEEDKEIVEFEWLKRKALDKNGMIAYDFQKLSFRQVLDIYFRFLPRRIFFVLLILMLIRITVTIICPIILFYYPIMYGWIGLKKGIIICVMLFTIVKLLNIQQKYFNKVCLSSIFLIDDNMFQIGLKTGVLEILNNSKDE